MRNMKKIPAILLISGIMLLSGCSLFGNSTATSAINGYDFSAMKLIQFDEPAEGQMMAVIETNYGTVKAVLYPEYAPNTVDNFVNRANEGYYDGKEIYALIEDALFLTGAYNTEGTQGFTNDGNPIPNECSVDLWPFKGALCAYSGNPGYGDSRFFIVNNKPLTDEEIAQLRGIKDENGNQRLPEELIKALVEKGSFANIAGYYTVFGQTVEGIGVVEKMCAAERDSETLRPVSEMKLITVKITEYHAEEEKQ